MKSNLTRFAILSAICLLFVSVGMATPTCPKTAFSDDTNLAAHPYTNADGSANGYVCDLSNLEFSNFTYTDSPLTVAADAVTVQPDGTAGDQGFDFKGGWNKNTDVSVSFTVTALTGLIDDVGIDIGAAFTSGTGDISYLEQFCTTTSTGGNQVCSIFTDSPTGPLSTDILLSNTALGGPVKTLNIIKDVDISGVGANGTAFLSDFANHYSNTVPEPRAVSVLLSLGLFAAILFMKKRSKAVRG
jgi:hypothetical protein